MRFVASSLLQVRNFYPSAELPYIVRTNRNANMFFFYLMTLLLPLLRPKAKGKCLKVEKSCKNEKTEDNFRNGFFDIISIVSHYTCDKAQ